MAFWTRRQADDYRSTIARDYAELLSELNITAPTRAEADALCTEMCRVGRPEDAATLRAVIEIYDNHLD